MLFMLEVGPKSVGNLMTRERVAVSHVVIAMSNATTVKRKAYEERQPFMEKREREWQEVGEEQGQIFFFKCKDEDINAVSEESKDGQILLTSSLDSAQLVAIDDLIMHD